MYTICESSWERFYEWDALAYLDSMKLGMISRTKSRQITTWLASMDSKHPSELTLQPCRNVTWKPNKGGYTIWGACGSVLVPRPCCSPKSQRPNSCQNVPFFVPHDPKKWCSHFCSIEHLRKVLTVSPLCMTIYSVLFLFDFASLGQKSYILCTIAPPHGIDYDSAPVPAQELARASSTWRMLML